MYRGLKIIILAMFIIAADLQPEVTYTLEFIYFESEQLEM